MNRIMFASIDEAYSLYYVPGDSEGRWIITDDAGVAATNYNIPEELAGEAEQAEEIIKIGKGDPIEGYEHRNEVRELMIRWGWLA